VKQKSKKKKEKPASWLSFRPSIVLPIFEHDKVEEEKEQNRQERKRTGSQSVIVVRVMIQTPRLEKILLP